MRAQWQELVWKVGESAAKHASRAFALYQELQDASGEKVMPATSIGEFTEKIMKSIVTSIGDFTEKIMKSIVMKSDQRSPT